MTRSILLLFISFWTLHGSLIAQTDLPIRALEPTISGEGIENLVRYTLPDGGSATISINAAHVVDEQLLLLQGLDEGRPGFLGMHMLRISENEGLATFEGWWASARRVDSLPEHYAMRLMAAQAVGEQVFLGFAMEAEKPVGWYVVGVGPDGEEIDGYVEAIQWNPVTEDWDVPSFQVRTAVGSDVRIAAEGVLYAVQRDGDWHLAEAKRVAYRHAGEQGFVLDYYPEGIHELKVKGLGKLQYYLPVPGHVVFIGGRPKDLVKAGKAISEAEGKRDVRMFSSNGAFEAYYLRKLDPEKYEGEWEAGFLGRLMGEKLER